MAKIVLTQVQLRMLESLNDVGPISVDLENAVSIAKALGTTTKEMADARNTLASNGFLTHEAGPFTNGASVSTITQDGRDFLDTIRNTPKIPKHKYDWLKRLFSSWK